MRVIWNLETENGATLFDKRGVWNAQFGASLYYWVNIFLTKASLRVTDITNYIFVACLVTENENISYKLLSNSAVNMPTHL